MKIDTHRLASERVAAVSGRIDLRSAPELRDEAMAALAAVDGALVLDLSAVEFIDSSGLGVLIGLERESQRLQGRLVLVQPTGSAAQIFALTRTESFFTIAANEEDGRAAIAA